MLTSSSLLVEYNYRLFLRIPAGIKDDLQALKKNIFKGDVPSVCVNLCSNEALPDSERLLASQWSTDDLLLVQFDSLAVRETLLMTAINQVARRTDGLMLRLEGIEKLPSHSFLIPVASRPELSKFSDQLKTIRQAIRSQSVKPFFIRDYRISLFRKLEANQYATLLPRMEVANLRFQVVANELILKRRNKEPYAPWEEIQSFVLRKEQKVIQPNLF